MPVLERTVLPLDLLSPLWLGYTPSFVRVVS